MREENKGQFQFTPPLEEEVRIRLIRFVNERLLKKSISLYGRDSAPNHERRHACISLIY